MLEFFRLATSPTSKAGSLSYGQQKLLDAAMAFMAGPRLVLLDEPAGGVNLDHAGEPARAAGGDQPGEGATFVVIEHNMEFVMALCSRIIVLAEGRIIAQGDAGRRAARPEGDRGLSWPLSLASDPILTLQDVVAGYGKMTILNGISSRSRAAPSPR